MALNIKCTSKSPEDLLNNAYLQSPAPEYLNQSGSGPEHLHYHSPSADSDGGGPEIIHLKMLGCEMN